LEWRKDSWWEFRDFQGFAFNLTALLCASVDSLCFRAPRFLLDFSVFLWFVSAWNFGDFLKVSDQFISVELTRYFCCVPKLLFGVMFAVAGTFLMKFEWRVFRRVFCLLRSFIFSLLIISREIILFAMFL